MTTAEKIKQIEEILNSIPKGECTQIVLMIENGKGKDGVLLHQSGDYSELSAICAVAIEQGIRLDNYVKIGQEAVRQQTEMN